VPLWNPTSSRGTPTRINRHAERLWPSADGPKRLVRHGGVDGALGLARRGSYAAIAAVVAQSVDRGGSSQAGRGASCRASEACAGSRLRRPCAAKTHCEFWNADLGNGMIRVKLAQRGTTAATWRGPHRWASRKLRLGWQATSCASFSRPEENQASLNLVSRVLG